MKQRIPTAFILDRKAPKRRGRISGLPLSAELTITTDKWGIPRIKAANKTDLYMAQGYIHASERLWQMESIRRFASGRLSEIAGEKFLELDYFSRLAQFPEVCRRGVENLSDDTVSQIEAYLKGVNHYIESRKGKLPLEFRSIGLKPEPWTLSDVVANLVINSWYLQTNYLEEILAIRTRNKLTRKQWDAIIPGMSAFDGGSLPEDAYFESLRSLNIGQFIPAAFSFYKEFQVICGASNNWITSDGPEGKPLLANDPHLGIQVPQIWFACGLECPGIDILGVGMPGFPGIIIGRTPTAAWGFTNVMTDIVDLFVLRIDPEKKTCVINGKETPLKVRKETFYLPDGRKEIRTIYDSPHGPLLTEITPDTNAAAALKWYGTLPENTLHDHTGNGILAFSGIQEISDLKKHAASLSAIGQNIVAGDNKGNILWQTSGSIPIRKGYSGRLPA
ncbi:MAG: penicillin acylase family protein, partial [Spirochaetaceae bacterium]|nr:penicillin acylase family protein [Spirochaetaceae bacterium]